jgi:nucleoside-diphosphate-sugar epimerase
MTYKILITGGSGYLGSNLVDVWKKEGHSILIIDNYSTGKPKYLLNNNNNNNNNIIICEGDISNNKFVDECFSKFEPNYVIHAAASYNDPNNWIKDVNTNINGTINTCKAAEKYNVKKLIYLQTALCYGRPQILPIPINHQLLPITSYGISKTAGEYYALMSNIPVISLRLANVTGPRLSIGPIPIFYRRLKAGQMCYYTSTVRDFIDMGDFIEIMNICLRNTSLNGIYNVSSGIGYTIKNIYDIIVEYLNIKKPISTQIPIQEDDVEQIILDSTFTEKIFNWKAQIDIKTSIVNLLKWYDKNNVVVNLSHLRYK